jgi:hypothetical protein
MTEFVIDSVRYSVNTSVPSNGAFVINSDSPPSNWDLVIPATVTYNSVTYDVKKVNDSAFLTLANLRNLTIPNSVTEIGISSFQGSGLTNIVSFGGVTKLNRFSFSGTSLRSLTFPIDRDFTFFNENPSCFSGCGSLTSVTYGSMISSIPNFMFEGCNALASFTNYGGLTAIGAQAFYNCNLNQEFIISDSVTYLAGAAFSLSGITKVTIGSQITSIGNFTFSTSQGRLLTAVFKGTDIPTISSTSNFEATGDTAYYRPGATNVSRLTPFFTNVLEGLPGDFSAPQNVTSVAGNQTATISWSAVTITAPDTITKYRISYYNTLSSSSITTVDVSGNITEKEITGLTNGQTYSFSVKAYSGDYVSVASSSVTAKPFILYAPSYLGFTATSDVLNSASLDWASDTDPDPTIITKYQVSYYELTTSSSVTTVDVNRASGRVQTTTISGLTNAKTFVFSVKAFVNSRSSAASYSVNGTPNFSIDYLTYGINPSDSNAFVISNISPPSNWDLELPSSVTCSGVAFAVKKIGNSAFQNVSSLRNITIPNSVTEIVQGAFNASGLTNIVSFGGVTYIGQSAFKACGLKSVTFPDNRIINLQFNSTGNGLFMNCTSLTSVRYSNLMTEIPNFTFLNCTSLTSFTNYGALTQIADSAFENTNLNQDFTIPDSVTYLGPAFNNSGITKVTFACSQITAIAPTTFKSRSNELMTVVFDVNNIPTISSTGNFNSTSDTAYYRTGATNVSRLTPFFTSTVQGLLGNFSAPQNVTGIARVSAATISWSAVTDSAPDSITKYQISYYNTASSSTITTVDVSGNITEKEITGLTNAQTYSFSVRAYSGDYVSVASSSVTVTPFAIVKPEGNLAIPGISSATVSWSAVSVPSPNTITKYEISYFDTATPSSVTTVDVSGNITEKIITGLTPFQTYIFRITAYVNSSAGTVSDDNATTTPYLLADSLVYKYNPSAPSDGVVVQNNDSPPSNWDLVIPSSVTNNGTTYSVKKVDEYALQNVANLRNLTIPNSVTEIARNGFQGSGLTNVVSFGGVTKINIFAFAGTALQNITLPNDRDITVHWLGLGSDIFRGCTSLTSVTYGSMITEIGDRMFKDCTSLTSFTNYDGLTAIRGAVFENCNLNQEFIIPDSVSVIDGSAFGNSGINKVTIGGLITSIGNYTFTTSQGRLLTAVFKGTDIPIISSVDNFNSTGDTAYYRPGATNVSRLTPFFDNIVEGLPGDFSAPQNVTATAGISAATINWTAVTSSTTITNYKISYYNVLTPSSITVVDVSGNLTQKIISGLTNFQTYGFSIKAYSGDYMSVDSSTVTTTPYSIDAPQNVTGTAGISAATISWSAVTVQAPDTITKYQISYYNTLSSSSVTTVDVSANLTQKEITGLTNFQTYGFSVKAFVNSFSSDASSIVTVTPYSIDAPQNVMATAGISAATINWSAVSVLSPNTITKYQISYYNTSTSSSISTVDVSGNLTEKEITGLTINNSYGFSVKAFVNSLSSVASSSVTVELSASNILNDVLNNPTAEPPTPTFFYDLITSGFTTQELLSAGVTTIPVTSGEAITDLLENYDFPSINVTSDISIPSGKLESTSVTIGISNLSGGNILITN